MGYKSTSRSSKYKLFYTKYNSLNNEERKFIDDLLSYISKYPLSLEYSCEIISFKQVWILNIYDTLCILQPRIFIHYPYKCYSSIRLSWTEKFNVPIQYYIKKTNNLVKYAPVIRDTICKEIQKSSLHKNPWSGRLRNITVIDYKENV